MTVHNSSFSSTLRQILSRLIMKPQVAQPQGVVAIRQRHNINVLGWQRVSGQFQ